VFFLFAVDCSEWVIPHTGMLYLSFRHTILLFYVRRVWRYQMV